jgi:predicted dehydrogenase
VTIKTVEIAMNGVTGRMGYRQHLVRSILAIREAGGLDLPDGTTLMPEPILIGRNEAKLRRMAEQHKLERWTTSVEEALSSDSVEIYFDSAVTSAREPAVKAAIAAGKHIYCEKPTATTLAGALELGRLARDAGVKSGVVQDKLFLPGLRKLKRLIDGGFFGQILSVRGEFGYWVFEGDWQPANRPSWNYRAEDGGGIVLDMFPHWDYVLRGLFGPIRTVQAIHRTGISKRVDELGRSYDATADDAAYGIFELDNGIVAQINSSWTVRVNRDELVEFQVDGTEGSAVAGLRRCRVQHRSATPMPVWDPDMPTPLDFRSQWQEVPDNLVFDNGFKIQWEQFLRHVYAGGEWTHDLLSGARGLQLAELGLQAAAQGRRVDVPELEL